MSSKPKSRVQSSLLATIQRKVPSNNATEPETQLKEEPVEASGELSVRNKPDRKTSTGTGKPKNRVGKPVQFWLHDEDRKLVRELAAWLAGQGLRATDSLIIRSALRMARTGGELLTAYRQASEQDGRLKQHKNT